MVASLFTSVHDRGFNSVNAAGSSDLEILDRWELQNSGHAAFPSLLVHGESLVLAFRSGSGHSGPDGKLTVMGLRVVGGKPLHIVYKRIIDTPLDDRDPSLTAVNDTLIILSFFGMNNTATQMFMARSRDGMSWTAPYPLQAQGDRCGAWWASSAEAITSRHGMLLLPVYTKLPGDVTESSHLLGSHDGGRTWRCIGMIARDQRQTVNFSEPAIVQIGDTLIAVLRTEQYDSARGFLYQSVSFDDGRSWELRPSGIWGFPAHMVKFGGAIVLTYGYRNPPIGVRVAFSRGVNLRWCILGALESRATHPDTGYPSTVALGGSVFLTAYYATVGEATTIRLVRFRIRRWPSPCLR